MSYGRTHGICLTVANISERKLLGKENISVIVALTTVRGEGVIVMLPVVELVLKVAGFVFFALMSAGLATVASDRIEKMVHRFGYGLLTLLSFQAAVLFGLWCYLPWGLVKLWLPICLIVAAWLAVTVWVGVILTKLIRWKSQTVWARYLGDGLITLLGVVTALLAGGWLMRYNLPLPLKLGGVMAFQIQVVRYLWGDKLQGRIMVGQESVRYVSLFVAQAPGPLITLGVFSVVSFAKVELLAWAIVHRLGLPAAIPSWSEWPASWGDGLCGGVSLVLAVLIGYLPWLVGLWLYRFPVIYRAFKVFED